jgi:hypothetical protein
VENRVIGEIREAENDAERARSAIEINTRDSVPILEHEMLIARDWEIGMALALARAQVADLSVVGDMTHRMEMLLAGERERDSEMAAAITRMHATLRPSPRGTLLMAWLVFLHVLLFAIIAKGTWG